MKKINQIKKNLKLASILFAFVIAFSTCSNDENLP